MENLQIGYKKESRIGLIKAALIGIPLGIGILLVSTYFQIEPIASAITSLGNGAKTLIVDPLITNISPYLNPATLISMVMVAGTAFIGKLWKNRVDSEKAQLQNQSEQTLLAYNDIAKQNGELQGQIKTLEGRLENTQTTDSKVLLKEAEDLVLAKNKEMETMQIDHNATVRTLHNEINRLKIQVKEIKVVEVK